VKEKEGKGEDKGKGMGKLKLGPRVKGRINAPCSVYAVYTIRPMIPTAESIKKQEPRKINNLHALCGLGRVVKFVGIWTGVTCDMG